MPDYYQLPALILTALLLPAFGHLYFRFRDTRSLLWFLGFLFATLRMVLLYRRKLDTSKWFLRLAVPALLLPFIANATGWIFTEMGRQP